MLHLELHLFFLLHCPNLPRYGLNVCTPTPTPNLYVEAQTPHVMALGGGPWGGDEGGHGVGPRDGISAPFLQERKGHRGTQREGEGGHLSASKRASPERTVLAP